MEKEVLTQIVGKVKFYVNINQKDKTQDLISMISKDFERKYQELFENSEYKEALYFVSEIKSIPNLVIEQTISILFLGLYQTHTNYYYIYPFLYKILNDFKNTELEVANKKFLIAIMSIEIVSEEEMKFTLERSVAHLIKAKNDNRFALYQSEEEALNYVKEKIKKNFFFINCHRETKFHEIDPKLIEARLCLAYGLKNISIAYICIILEETLKTLLKYKIIHDNQDPNSKPSLTEVKDLSNKAQKKYGSESLGACIKFAFNENIITDDEKKILNRINNFLRNAHIHSDKSKMFSKNKTNVKLVGFEGGKIEITDEQELSINELIYVQGFMQTYLAEKNAKKIFYDIEEIIYTICNRYWKRLEKE